MWVHFNYCFHPQIYIPKNYNWNSINGRKNSVVLGTCYDEATTILFVRSWYPSGNTKICSQMLPVKQYKCKKINNIPPVVNTAFARWPNSECQLALLLCHCFGRPKSIVYLQREWFIRHDYNYMRYITYEISLQVKKPFHATKTVSYSCKCLLQLRHLGFQHLSWNKMCLW